jgi:DNA-binding transcriptional regulator YiaG
MNYNGNDLKAIRQRNKLSQKEFGKLLGRNEADYQRVEAKGATPLSSTWQILVHYMYHYGIETLKQQ